MKSAYKLLALALVAIMTLGCFAACAETGDQTADTTLANAETQAPIVDVETTENPYDADGYLKSSLPDELDFGGEAITVLWWTDVENPSSSLKNRTAS